MRRRGTDCDAAFEFETPLSAAFVWTSIPSKTSDKKSRSGVSGDRLRRNDLS
ncbi:hypothetical protein RE6C_01644 [Rhodopirellula europaea 6C]|uniref:Uncharacterized protein n=1 Tax=Rhodopirellula europaea 6C TaxID=1263867 RepID=M2B774_9BACT|nr:hypothetical protein RE6C_01644 [Rhodopirellula europaea 6C]